MLESPGDGLFFRTLTSRCFLGFRGRELLLGRGHPCKADFAWDPVGPALACLDVGDVAKKHSARLIAGETLSEQVWHYSVLVIRVGGLHSKRSFCFRAQAKTSHASSHGVFRNFYSLTLQSLGHPWTTVSILFDPQNAFSMTLSIS